MIPMRIAMLGLLLVSLVAVAGAATTDKAVEALKRNDFKTALGELRPLAARNDANAQFLLGMMYDAGKGVAHDPSTAASWYRKAATRNHILAQLYLGVLYHSGEGVKKDYKEAARWFKVPAENGNDQAQFFLGWMYSAGDGVEKNETRAIEWLGKAAVQGNPRAMGMLATQLFSRSRDEQDRIDAYTWSHLAAELDPIQATTSARKVIEGYCTEDQKKKGKKAMAEWKRKWSAAAGGGK